ncbi:transcriptional regulator [Kitasatospora cheerisanensis KCTC 2395]|uniref:Transcriptional regulator n=1 Tax=Kitasatospora cheerisanensis KCTC 2395 TaxID=1348663 RepID=A0A066ZBX7_9ACTN|nr:transcriptional regulator [Kitasatospora cheerisanensis KCTC 2395]
MDSGTHLRRAQGDAPGRSQRTERRLPRHDQVLPARGAAPARPPRQHHPGRVRRVAPAPAPPGPGPDPGRPDPGGHRPRGARAHRRRLPRPHHPPRRGHLGPPAVPRTRPASEDDPSDATARTLVGDLLDRLGWTTARELGDLSPAHRSLVSALATLDRLGYPFDADDLLPYAHSMEQAAAYDLDRMELLPTAREQAEYAVAGAVLFEPVLLNLRRLAQSEQSTRRYGL